jgi:nucleotide-binding universal stress UspA family protein
LELIIAPEFADSLGFGASVNAAEKVMGALKAIGMTILDLVKKEGKGTLEIETFLDYGMTVEQIVKRSGTHDLVVIGHRGKGPVRTLTAGMIGSVAERTVLLSKKPVLVAVSPVKDVKEFAVAFDGSEPARGALLLAESLAKKTGKKLKAIVVAPTGSKEHVAEANLTAEQGARLLGITEKDSVFSVVEGPTTTTILKYAIDAGALLIVGAYGYRTPEENVLGSTTTGIIRRTETSVLIYR